MNNNELMIYEDKDGITKVNVKFMNEDLWISKYQIANIYKTTRQNIEQHINNIYKDKELLPEATCKSFLQVQQEGNRSELLQRIRDICSSERNFINKVIMNYDKI